MVGSTWCCVLGNATAVRGQSNRAITSTSNIINLADKILYFFKAARLIVFGNLLLEQTSPTANAMFRSVETNKGFLFNQINSLVR